MTPALTPGERFRNAFTELVRTKLTKPKDFQLVSFRALAAKHGTSNNLRNRLEEMGLVEETTTMLGVKPVRIYAATPLAFKVLESNFDWNRFPISKIKREWLEIASRQPMYGGAVLTILEQVKSAQSFSNINVSQIAYSNNVPVVPLLNVLHAARAIDWRHGENGAVLGRRTYLTGYLAAFDWKDITSPLDIQPSVLHNTLREALYKDRPELSRNDEPLPIVELAELSDAQLFGAHNPTDLHNIITSNDLSVGPPEDEDEVTRLTRELTFMEEQAAKVRAQRDAAAERQRVEREQAFERKVRDALEGCKLKDVQDVINKLRKEGVVII